MSVSTARILTDIQVREVINDGIRQGGVPESIREDIQLADVQGSPLKVYGVTFTIAPSTTTVLDLFGSNLAGGVALPDKEGNPIDYATVNALVVRNKRPTTDVGAWVTVGPDATAGFGAPGFWPSGATTGNQVDPASFATLYSAPGVAVADGSADEIALVTSGIAGDHIVDFIVIGRE
jgi:hypothetical protein